MTFLFVVVVVLALVFAVTNGLHDTAAAVAGSISTRTLTPGVALLSAAFFSALGSLVGAGVIRTIRTSVVTPPAGAEGLRLLAAGLLAAVCWNLWTWRRGVPSSSTYALVGGLVGSGIDSGSAVRWPQLLENVVVPLLVFPVVAFGVAYLSMVTVIRTAYRLSPGTTNRRFRVGQAMASAAVALGHGVQNGQKTVGVLLMALALVRDHAGGGGWIRPATALALGCGMMLGGWRIMRTMGRRIVPLDPAKGFVSEASAAGTLMVAAALLGAPVSTSYTLTSSLVGVGTVRGWRRVRWRVVGQIVVAAAVTLPVTVTLGALFHLAFGALF